MSSNRLSYDTCAYKERIGRSIAPINHILDQSRYEHSSKCRHELGLVGEPTVYMKSIEGGMVDLESDLRGITRQNTQCPSYKYLPQKVNTITRKNVLTCAPILNLNTNQPKLESCQMINYKNVPSEQDVSSRVGAYSCKAFAPV